MLHIVYIHMFKQWVCMCVCVRTPTNCSVVEKEATQRESYICAMGAGGVDGTHPVLYCSIWNAIPSFVYFFIQIAFLPWVVVPPCAKLELSPCIFFFLLPTAHNPFFFFFSGALFVSLSSVYISLDFASLWFHWAIKTPSPQRQRRMMLVIAFLVPPT